MRIPRASAARATPFGCLRTDLSKRPLARLGASGIAAPAGRTPIHRRRALFRDARASAGRQNDNLSDAGAGADGRRQFHRSAGVHGARRWIAPRLGRCPTWRSPGFGLTGESISTSCSSRSSLSGGSTGGLYWLPRRTTSLRRIGCSWRSCIGSSTEAARSSGSSRLAQRRNSSISCSRECTPNAR